MNGFLDESFIGVDLDSLKKPSCICYLDLSGFTKQLECDEAHNYLGSIHMMHLFLLKYANDKIKIIDLNRDSVLLVSDEVIDMLNFVVPVFNNLNDICKIKLNVGISYCDILTFKEDVYGHCVELATKLGKEIAENGQILIEKNAVIKLKLFNNDFKEKDNIHFIDYF
jgi:hypothetical protein